MLSLSSSAVPEVPGLSDFSSKTMVTVMESLIPHSMFIKMKKLCCFKIRDCSDVLSLKFICGSRRQLEFI